jgi:uncharacterized protein DUF6982
MANEVVARYLDGRVVKGVCLDVDPARPMCHIKTGEQGMVRVKLTELKALFFVKDLVGNATHEEGSTVGPDDARAHSFAGIEVEFKDGERVTGLTARYPPVRPFFYILPADTASNNIRILVNRAAVVKMGQP